MAHGLRIKHLTDSGILEAEAPALEKIENELPPEWLAYSNFEFRDKSFGNREVDLILVTQDNIIIVELKNWNGDLYSDGQRWIQNGQNRGKSPVIVTNDKAKKLKSLFNTREGHNFPGDIYIEPLVVLCGSAGPHKLSEEDKQFTVTIEDFCKLGNKGKFKKIFPRTRPRPSPLCKEKEIFNRLFSLKIFNARQYRYNEYIPKGKSNFKHTAGLYEEYIAENEFSLGNRALLRTWDLSALPALYSTETQWRSLTRREDLVIGYLKMHLSRETAGNSLLSRIGGTPETELSSSNFELYELPSHSDLLESYIHRSAKRLSLDDRIELSKKLLVLFSQLHEVNVAHRDISETSIWTGHDLNIAVSRWLVSSFPEGKTVGDVRDYLHSGRSVAPEDLLEYPSNPFKRDVFLLGRVIYFIISGRNLPLDNGIAEYEPLTNDLENEGNGAYARLRDIEPVLEKSLDLDPKIRYENAIEMLESFQSIVLKKQSSPKIFAKKIAPFKKEINPYLEFRIDAEIQRAPINIFESTFKGQKVLVKIWPSLQPSDTDEAHNYRLFTFLTTCADMQRTRHSSTQHVVDFGISQLGLYLVVELCAGPSLREYISNSGLEKIDRVCLGINLLKITRSIHESGISHGDIKPGNVYVVTDENSEQCLKFIDIPDIDPDGAEKKSQEYMDQTKDVSDPKDQDRYACLVTLVEVLSGNCDLIAGKHSLAFEDVLYEDIEDQISKHFSDPDPVKSLDIVLGLLAQMKEELLSGELRKLTIPLKNLSSREVMLPDGDYYPILIKSMSENDCERARIGYEQGRYFDVQLLGVANALALVWDAKESVAQSGRLQGPAPDFIRKKAVVKLRAFIVLERGENTDLSSLNAVVHDVISNEVQRAIAASRKEPPAPSPASQEEKALKVDVPAAQVVEERKGGRYVEEIWRSLIEAEANILPEVEIVDEPEITGINSRRISFLYEMSNGYPIEFDSSETVIVQLVRDESRSISIGKLVQTDLTSEVMTVELYKNLPPSTGDKLRLEGVLGKASYDKRRQAVERLISGESIHPNLMKWISGENSSPVINDDLLIDWEGELPSELSLNKKQLESIKLALTTSPISLVQGPPGTGKTLFIAALIYLLKNSSDDNILLTSQSHEAVNNCIEKLISVYEEDIDLLDVVRVGSLAMCSEPVAKYHIDNIQSRYLHKFESDIRFRIENSASSLGLPKQFVSQYVRLSISFRPLNEQYKLIAIEDSEELDQKQVSNINGLIESAKGRMRRISAKLRWPESLEFPNTLQFLKEQLIDVHQITNEDAVHRLSNFVDIAFEWKEALTSPHGNFGEFLTRTKRIVAGTCVGIGRKSLNITSQKFDWVVIDEAARCTSSELAIPASIGERLILVGDHQQLPPLYPPEVIDSARRATGATSSVDLMESDFRRLIEGEYGNKASKLLTTQYRMNTSIGEMVSDIFYLNKLKSGKSDEFLAPDSMPEFMRPEVVWLDTWCMNSSSLEHKELDDRERETKSYINKGEINEILDLLRAMSENDELLIKLRGFYSNHGEPIGVICAYAGQKRELIRAFRQRAFPDHFRELIKIDTVDSYQGKENLIIIQSLVRNNAKGISGFLLKSERVNVAMSRAMERVYIVGASAMWANQDAPLGKVYRFIKNKSLTDKRYRIVNAVEKGW